jgi:hypothetical protein
MEFRLRALHLILDTVMAIQLVNNQLVIVFIRQVGVFEELEAEGSRRGFESEVNKGELSLRVAYSFAVNAEYQTQLG